jgi:hypothetical protein
MISGVETTLQAVSVVCAGFFEGAVQLRNISKSNLQRLTHTTDLSCKVNRFCQHQIRRFYKYLAHVTSSPTRERACTDVCPARIGWLLNKQVGSHPVVIKHCSHNLTRLFQVWRIVVESSSGCLDIEIKFAPSYSIRLALLRQTPDNPPIKTRPCVFYKCPAQHHWVPASMKGRGI